MNTFYSVGAVEERSLLVVKVAEPWDFGRRCCWNWTVLGSHVSVFTLLLSQPGQRLSYLEKTKRMNDCVPILTAVQYFLKMVQWNNE